MSAGSILIVDERRPTPDSSGASLRMVHILGLLRDLGWEITFTAEFEPDGLEDDARLRELGVAVVPGDMPFERHLSEGGGAYDVVLASRPYVAARVLPHVRRLAPEALFVYDTLDLAFVRYYRQAKLTGNGQQMRLALALKRQELALVREADRTLAITRVEKEVLERECPGADIQVLSNVHVHPGARAGFDERSGLLFVGNMRHEPNVDAARLLITEVWPAIAPELPGARLFIVGDGSPDELRAAAPARASFTGQIPDLLPYYEGCRVSLAPLRFGAGVKGKVLEHMGHGLPVVGTEVAFEGIAIEPGLDALVAETPEEIAAAAVKLHSDRELWERLSRKAPRVVERDFSFEAARNALEAVLAPGRKVTAHA